MKLSLNWLKEYVTVPDDLPQFCDDLTMAGLEVEEVKHLSAADLVAGGGAGSVEDTVLNVKITPNRGDWLSVLGVARESAPLVGQKVELAEVPTLEWLQDQVPISVEAPDLCRRYIGIVIRGVKIGRSPDWMQDRLVAAGMRPINNVVDITNYVMLELGQPLHAFDLSLLKQSSIVVRRARAGEKLVSIDGQERSLDQDTLVIADAVRPVAIAGVMGGVESEIGENTTDLLLESANFDPVSVRRTSKRLGLTTESSYRFERTVDPSICLYAAVKAAQLIAELAHAKSLGTPNDVYPKAVRPIEVSIDPAKVNRLLGLDLTSDQMISALSGYEIFATACDNDLICRVPTYRPDVNCDVDIIEEIGRGYGYEKIPMRLPNIPTRGKDSPQGELRSKIRRILMSCGMQEVLSHSMIERRIAALAARPDIVAIKNPLSLGLDSMRRMLIPNLLDILADNQSHSSSGISLFETGKIYFNDSVEGIDEKLSVAGLVCGNLWNCAWGMVKTAPVHDFYSCKGIVEALLSELGVAEATFAASEDPMLHGTRTAQISAGQQKIGIMGQISPDIAEQLDIKGEAFAFELDLEILLSFLQGATKFVEIARYPSTTRHMTMKAAENILYADILSVAMAAGGDLARDIELVDVFRGEKIGSGVKSITIAVEFRSDTRTLLDEEVSKSVDIIKSALTDKIGVEF